MSDGTYLDREPSPEEERVPFVSREAPAAPKVADQEQESSLHLMDPVLRLILLLAFGLQLWTWYGLEGYQLADSVEYMERAHAFVRSEEVIDSSQIRSFGFSALLVPFFAVFHWLGIEDHTSLVWFVRLIQMTLGLGLVFACARLGQRLGGRTTGLLAAFVVGVNPVFLQYSVSPLADVAGSLGVALALYALLEPQHSFRTGRRSGLLIGLALLMAYKTAPLSATMIGLAILRDRRKILPALGGMVVGIGTCVAFQIVLDKLVYGIWGGSLLGYFGQNVLGVIGKIMIQLGFVEQGKAMYEWYYGFSDTEGWNKDYVLRSIQPASWYLLNLPQLFVYPILVGLVAGLVRTVKQATWVSSMILLTTVVFVWLLHQKGSKEFRLCLPLLAALGPIAGWGLAWIAGQRGAALWRPALVVLGLGASVHLGLEAQRARNTQAFAGYWRALDYVEARVAEERDANPDLEDAAIASAYHWAIFLRTSSDLELTKLRHQIDAWARLSDEQRNNVYPVLKEQDWFLVHQPILTQEGHESLAYVVNVWFQLEAVFWDREYEDLGPVLVMKRKADEFVDPKRRTLFDRQKDVPADAAKRLSRELGMPEPIRMIKPAHGEEMWMLGFTYETLDGDGHGWLSTWWYNEKPCLADYSLVERLTSHDERHSWVSNARPTWGVIPTNTWEGRTLIRESRLVIAADGWDRWREPFRPLGGAYRRGDYLPAFLWIDMATFYWECSHCRNELAEGHECGGVLRDVEADGSKQVSGRLERARFGDEEPMRVGDPAEIREDLADIQELAGWRWSADGLTQAGRFFLRVHPSMALPDDGRAIPD
ncbi:MAG: glycosyltransferase family 39 protein [Planctomycetota bacterium]|nr:glycosyltransferase family 39 protein [Planctomycetota bacterium]